MLMGGVAGAFSKSCAAPLLDSLRDSCRDERRAGVVERRRREEDVGIVRSLRHIVTTEGSRHCEERVTIVLNCRIHRIFYVARTKASAS